MLSLAPVALPVEGGVELPRPRQDRTAQDRTLLSSLSHYTQFTGLDFISDTRVRVRVCVFAGFFRERERENPTVFAPHSTVVVLTSW